MTANRKRILGFCLLAIGLALCCNGAWNLLSPPTYQAAARIEDFLQVDFELLRSEPILSKAGEILDLKTVWARRHAGDNPLGADKVLRRLRAGMSVRSVQNTKKVDICFTSEDPAEAAKIANAISDTYREHRLEEWRQRTIKGIQGLEERLKQQKDKVNSAQKNVEGLRQELNVPHDDTNYLSRVEYQPYWTAKHELDLLIRFRDILKFKIESENIYLQSSKPAWVALIDPATPPSSPINQKRRDTTILVFGLAMVGFGLRLTVRSHRS